MAGRGEDDFDQFPDTMALTETDINGVAFSVFCNSNRQPRVVVNMQTVANVLAR